MKKPSNKVRKSPVRKRPIRKVAVKPVLSPKQKAFLAAYAECGVIAQAALAARTGRRSHYEWMESGQYSEAFAEAHKDACEALESEARLRAEKGVAEPVIYQGQLCFEPLRDKNGQIRRAKNGHPILSKTPLVVYKKDSTLLMFIMKRLMPEYREAYKLDHTGEVNLRFKGSLGELLATYRDLTKPKEKP
jgi:hypothetical protein